MATGSIFLTPVTLTTEQQSAIRQALQGHLDDEQYSELFGYIEKLLKRLASYKPESTPITPGALHKELNRLANQLLRAQKTLAYLEIVEKGEGWHIDREFMCNTGKPTLIEISAQIAREPPFKSASGIAWMLDEIRKAVEARIESVTPKKGEQSDHYDLLIIHLACYFKAFHPSIRPAASEGPFFRLVSYLLSSVLNLETRRQGGKAVENPKRRIDRALKLLRQGSEQTNTK